MLFDSSYRRLAHQAVDAMFDHVETIESRPVVDWHPAAELRERVAIGAGGHDLMERIRFLSEHAIQLHHPSYMGHQVCPPFPTAVIADLVISTLNQSTAVWEMSPVATLVEQEVVRWLGQRAGYVQEALGTVVSGGSAANLTGLLAARARWSATAGRSATRPVVVCSADAHYSVARAASIMGIGVEDVIKVDTDDAHRLDPAALEAVLQQLRGDEERSVLAVVATAGSTATGAFDDLSSIAEVCAAHQVWLHVDAAHGASVLLSERLRHLVNGLERADSLAWDPHKMLWMPLSFGVILVREGHWLRRAFQADAPYLFNAERATDNLGEMTIQCSKRAEAVKLWLTLQTVGTGPFEAALDSVAALTRALYDRVLASDDFEAMHDPDFNIFCFRYLGSPAARIPSEELDARNGQLREALIRSGRAWITSTILKGRRVLRVTMINPRTTIAHVEAMLEAVRELAASTAGAA